MKFLAFEVERPGLTSADFAPYLKAEAQRAQELQQAGLIVELYFRADQHTAVLLLDCADAATAQAALNTLPLVERGLIYFDLMPLLPYDGFERLR